MDFTFEDAAPVKATNPGRPAEPNPFKDIVQSIALQVDPETKLPRAKSFVVDSGTVDKDGKPTDDAARALVKILRQLGEAGALCTPEQVSVKKVTAPATKTVKGEKVEIPGKTAITFWTRKKITQAKPTDKPAETVPADKPATAA